MDDVTNMWQEKGWRAKLRSRAGSVALLYFLGLLGCLVAGVRDAGWFFV